MSRENPSTCRGNLSTLHIGAALLLPTLVILAAVALQTRFPVAYLLRDPLVVAEAAPKCCSVYFGVVSNLGVILWIATASVCLMLFALTRLARTDAGLAAFFLAGGLFTFWLGLDDFFLVHENVLPNFGIPQPVTYSFYAAAGIGYLLVARRHILAGRTSLFLFSGACLAASMGLDVLVHSEAPFWVFLEDALKFVGIVFWAGFHVSSALATAATLVTPKHIVSELLPRQRGVAQAVT